MAEWIAAICAVATIFGTVMAFLIKTMLGVSSTINGNTNAINTLTEYMEKQDKKNTEQDETLENHEGRLIKIETVHELRGCAEADK